MRAEVSGGARLMVRWAVLIASDKVLRAHGPPFVSSRTAGLQVLLIVLVGD